LRRNFEVQLLINASDQLLSPMLSHRLDDLDSSIDLRDRSTRSRSQSIAQLTLLRSLVSLSLHWSCCLCHRTHLTCV